MQKSFTHEEMLDRRGCYSRQSLLTCSFMANEVITLDSILDSEIPLQDKLWFVYKQAGLTAENAVRLSLTLAKQTVKYFNTAYPSDDRVNHCVQVIEGYLKGEIRALAVLEAEEAANKCVTNSNAPSATDAAYAVVCAARSAYYGANEYDPLDAASQAAFADRDGKEGLTNILKDFVAKL